MFVFKIIDNRVAIESMVIRALLALGAIITLIYRASDSFVLNIGVSLILAGMSVFAKQLMLRFNLHYLLLIVIAAILIFIVTHTIAFPVMMILFAALVKFLYKQPEVHVGKEGVEIKRMAGSNHQYAWSDLANVVLKDKLLTLDFNNNRLLQLEIEESSASDEDVFNNFCRKFLHKHELH